MKKIVLLGAGYANMALIKSLPHNILNDYEFILISDTPLHYFSVLLHEVASGVHQDEVTLHIDSILPKCVKFIQDKVIRIQKDIVKTEHDSYEYDILVVGLGFQSDSFGIPGIKEHTACIVNYEGALALHKQIIQKLHDYKAADTSNDFQIVVCGAGFTGIEFIGSLAEELERTCGELDINRNKIKLVCVEANENILPMFNPKLASLAKEYLQKIHNVSFELGCKILECKEDCVMVEHNGEKRKVNASFTIWTAGVKGNQVIEDSKFFSSVRSKVEVNSYLQPVNQKYKKGMDKIFVIGDCASLKDPKTQRFYPPTAQISVKQGEFLAKLLVEKLQDRAFSQEFSYEPKGTICSVGSKYAIGYIGKIDIQGKVAVWAKKIIEAKWSFKLKGLKGIFSCL